MKERPILFSGAMVRAILNGEKTQTRRVVKPQPADVPITNGSRDGMYTAWPNADACLEWADVVSDPTYYAQAGFCPYGQPGDRLWVRETFAYHFGELRYRADELPESYYAGAKGWRPSIFMPRALSRITLEIVGVRVERVQDISMYDAMDEGVGKPRYSQFEKGSHLVGAFRDLWDEINEKRGYGWTVNPWVWVVEFKRI